MPNFINPYNFIPLGGQRGKIGDDKLQEQFSGVIEYKVLTKTPLFIPNTSNDKAFEVKFGSDANDDDKAQHKAYDFFSYHDLAEEKDKEYFNEKYFEPVISGSEIRGMLRSNYEILTNSCMSVADDVILSKRTSQVFKSGLLQKTEKGYELYKAEDCLWRTKGENNVEDERDWKNEYYTRKCYRQSDFTEGEKVYFQCVKRPLERGKAKPLAFEVSKTKTGNFTEEGYLILGEDGPEMKPDRRGVSPQKHCAHIFKKDGQKSIHVLSDLSILEKILAEYQDATKPNTGPNRYKKYAEELKKFQRGEKGAYFPVYYDLVNDGEIIFLSPASKTREVYQNKISDMLGDYKTCNDKSKLCPACSVFGTIGGEGRKKFAVASKLRFADLTVSEKKSDCKEYYGDIVTLTELSSPKLTNMEFYMKKPADNAVFWTYDYYIDDSGKIHVLNRPEINGRKFYWHNLKMQPNHNVTPNKRNMTIRPLNKNIVFKGKLYFDKVSEKELHSLIWLLNAGEVCDSIEAAKHGYKLGAAKPLGFGSIAVHVENVTLRCVDKMEDTIEYKEEAYSYRMDELSEDGSTLFHDSKTIKYFMKMTDFNSVPADKISYPIKEGQTDEEGFKWFAEENHKAYRRKKGDILPNSSPNDRTQEYYTWYLEPMKGELVETTHPVYNQEAVNTKGGQHRSSFIQLDRKKGEEYRGKVTGHNDKKTIAYVKLNDGGKASVFFKNIRGKNVGYGTIDQVLKENSSVTLVYMGKDDKNYDKWECI